MAEGKNKITVYRDWIDFFEPLTDDEAGKLIKHFFRYVNDLNPSSDRITELLFEPMKKILKRDLKKWEEVVLEKSNIGRIGNIKRWHLDLYNQLINKKITIEEAEQIAEGRRRSQKIANAINSSQNIADNDIVIVNDIVIKENNISATPPKFNFKQELLNYGFEESLVDDWLSVRKTKKAKNTKTAFEGFIREVEKTGKLPNDVLRIVVERSWQSFKSEWLIDKKQQEPQSRLEKFMNSESRLDKFLNSNNNVNTQI